MDPDDPNASWGLSHESYGKHDLGDIIRQRCSGQGTSDVFLEDPTLSIVSEPDKSKNGSTRIVESSDILTLDSGKLNLKRTRSF